MKKITMACLLAGLALASCRKSPQAQEAPERIVLSTPEPHLVAPPGAFFLTKKISMETDSGIINFRPGTKVNRVGNRYVTADGKQLTLSANQMTNNLQLAQRAAGDDAKAVAIIQAATRTARATQPAPAATSSETAPQGQSTAAPAKEADYARSSTGQRSEAEERRLDSRRQERK